jgi:hypothetical protein
LETLSITEIWRWLRFLPGFILKRIFSKKRLADLALFDVQPRRTSVSVNLGEHPTFAICFQLINMSPFELELDRAEFSFNCAGVLINIKHIKSSSYKSGEGAQVFIHGDIPEGKSNSIAKLHEHNESSINVHCEFKCKVHSFVKTDHLLDGVNVKFLNTKNRVLASSSAT